MLCNAYQHQLCFLDTFTRDLDTYLGMAHKFTYR